MTRHFSPACVRELLDPARIWGEVEMDLIECLARVSRKAPQDGRADVVEYLECAIACAQKAAQDAVAAVRSTPAMRDEDDQATLADVLAEMTEVVG